MTLVRVDNSIYRMIQYGFDRLKFVPPEASGSHGARRTDGLDASLFEVDRGDDHRFARLDPCDESVCTIRELTAGERAYD